MIPYQLRRRKKHPSNALKARIMCGHAKSSETKKAEFSALGYNFTVEYDETQRIFLLSSECKKFEKMEHVDSRDVSETIKTLENEKRLLCL